MSREISTEAQIRAEEARRAGGRDAPADHRGGDRAPRNCRAVPHDAERGRRAGRRGAPHPLPPLSDGGRPVCGLLTHYFAANPWPDLDTWRAIRDPQQRLEQALDELYAYYERTEPMFSTVLRDAELVDFARDAVAPLHAYLEEAAEVLTSGRRVRGRRRQLLGERCATGSPFRPGARSRPTASGDQMRRSSSARSSRPRPRWRSLGVVLRLPPCRRARQRRASGWPSWSR